MTVNEEVINENTNLVDVAAIENTEEKLIAHGYLWKLFALILLWMFCLIGFIWLVDPYGISPIQVKIPGFNTQKPKRLDIDRLIKPYEVWRYQPKTVFLGTSRIHQSIDPSVFDGTDYAPAYNASIPASTLAENEKNLELFLSLDPKIKHVFIELFLYNFVTAQTEGLSTTALHYFTNNYLPLQMSTDALLDAMHTLAINEENNPSQAYIAERGYRVPASDFNPATTFSQSLYIHSVIKWDHDAKMSLQISALQSLDRIVALAKRHGVQLHLLLTPNYPWDDIRLMELGYWPMLETWLRKMAAYPNVISFSQYNNYLEEAPTLLPKMKWWNDPIHFSLNMGHAMMQSLLGQAPAGTPSNLMRELNPSTVESIIAERRAGALRWAAAHPDFLEEFEEAKKSGAQAAASGIIDEKKMALMINGVAHPIVLGVGEVSIADKQANAILASGWAIDELAKKSVKLVATIGSSIVSEGYPSVERTDIEIALGVPKILSGFALGVPLATWDGKAPIRVFALMRDGRAVQLVSNETLITSLPIAGSFGELLAHQLVIDNKIYPLAAQTNGHIEQQIPIAQGYSVYGKLDDANTTNAIIAVVGTKVVAKTLLTVKEQDDKADKFIMSVPVSEAQKNSHAPMKFFVLMANGVAAEVGGE